jgi:hypothetical protein
MLQQYRLLKRKKMLFHVIRKICFSQGGVNVNQEVLFEISVNRGNGKKTAINVSRPGFPRDMEKTLWKSLRTEAWVALRDDRADDLILILEKYCSRLEISLQELISMLKIHMWNPEKGHPPDGLLAIAAGNDSGIPPQGCVACVEILLSVRPCLFQKEDIRAALERTSQCSNRENREELIRRLGSELAKMVN